MKIQEAKDIYTTSSDEVDFIQEIQNAIKNKNYEKVTTIIFEIVKTAKISKKQIENMIKEIKGTGVIMNYALSLIRNLDTVDKEQAICQIIPLYIFIFEAYYVSSIDILSYIIILNGKDLYRYKCEGLKCKKEIAKTPAEIKLFPATKKIKFCREFFKEKGLEKEKLDEIFDMNRAETRNKFSHADFEVFDEGKIMYGDSKTLTYDGIIKDLKNMFDVSSILLVTIINTFPLMDLELIFGFMRKTHEVSMKEDPEYKKMWEMYMASKSSEK